jgi:hypothetical protein
MQSTTLWTAVLAVAVAGSASATTTLGYEDIDLGPSGYGNNSPYSRAGVTHSNTFTDWGGGYSSWDGFAVSNHTDTTTAGYGNQYSSYCGNGAGGSSQYAVGYVSSATSTNLTFANATDMTGQGASFNNTTYAAVTILLGDSMFGTEAFTTGDWFKLTITGYQASAPTGSVDFYLADYRTGSAVVTDWQYVDFSPLGTVDEIRFTLSSSDNGDFGMNTPAYFAMDNLVVPEPGSVMLVACGGIGMLARRRR